MIHRGINTAENLKCGPINSAIVEYEGQEGSDLRESSNSRVTTCRPPPPPPAPRVKFTVAQQRLKRAWNVGLTLITRCQGHRSSGVRDFPTSTTKPPNVKEQAGG